MAIKSLILISEILVTRICFSQSTDENRTDPIIGLGENGYTGESRRDGVHHDMDSAGEIANSMGIPETNIKYIRNSESTKLNILKTLKTLWNSTTEGSRAFVYFSGHVLASKND